MRIIRTAAAAALIASLAACGQAGQTADAAGAKAAATEYVADMAAGNWTAAAELTTGPGAAEVAGFAAIMSSIVRPMFAAMHVQDDTVVMGADGQSATITDTAPGSKPVDMRFINGSWKIYVSATDAS